MKTNKLLWLVAFLVVFNCKENDKKKESDFTLIDRRAYFTDSFKDISVYRDNKTREVMDGYYVVGNDFTKWEEFNLDKGILNGNYITYHTNGNIASKENYVKGKLHGAENTYSLSGELNSTINYQKGIKHGKAVGYFESGQVSYESVFENNELIESTSYDIIGNIKSQTLFKDGKKITQQIKDGKIFYEQISSTYDDYEAIKVYNEDGSVKLYLRMIDDSDGSFIVEYDENEKEIKRIDLKKNPKEAMKYAQFFM